MTDDPALTSIGAVRDHHGHAYTGAGTEIRTSAGSGGGAGVGAIFGSGAEADAGIGAVAGNVATHRLLAGVAAEAAP